MALHVGVNVVEVDGRASPAIQPAATSIAAFLGLTERGVPDRPVRVTSLEQVRDRFGAARADAYLALAVEGFFLNGGREAHLCRVVGAGSAAASTTLNNGASTPAAVLGVSAGFRGSADPGAWGARMQLDVRSDPRASTTLQSGTAAGATSATLASVDGLAVGSVVRIVDGPTIELRKLTAVDATAKTISWSAALPMSGALAAGSAVTSEEFRLIVSYRRSAGAELEEVEDHRHLGMESDMADHAATRINHAITGSRYIALTDLSAGKPLSEKLPAVASGTPLNGGSEVAPAAADYTGSAAGRTGVHAFDVAQVQLLAAPDAHRLSASDRKAVVRYALDYCAARGDCAFVGSAPDRGGPAGVTRRALSDYTQLESDYLAAIKADAADLQGRKVYGALYAPWIRVIDTAPGAAGARFIPPDGHVMGVYARTDLERGIFKAPAGVEADVRGALEVAATFTEAEHTDMVRTGLVNGIRPTPGYGLVVSSSRTLSTDTRWWFVNVRLLFNFVKSSLRDGLRFVRQEPHTEELRRSVRLNVIAPFLLGLWRQGAFGEGPPEQVFTVKCDAENNPAADVDQGKFKVEVYFYPAKPVETILIVVGQQPAAATAGEG